MGVQVLLLALLVSLPYSREVLASDRLARGKPDEVGKAVQFVFLLVTVSLWFGMVASCREIIKERPIFEREQAAGVGSAAYLIAKTACLAMLVTVQVVLLFGMVALLRPLGAGTDGFTLALILSLAGFSAVGMGLAASAWARSSDQVSSLLPLLLLPQLLLAGTLIPLNEMPQPAKSIAGVVAARWAVAGSGSAVGLQKRLDANPEFALVPGTKASTSVRTCPPATCRAVRPYGRSFFRVDGLGAGWPLVLLGATGLLVAAGGLRRRMN